MLRTDFLQKSPKKYFYKSKKWTFINVQFSENQKRIQIVFFLNYSIIHILQLRGICKNENKSTE